MGERVQLEMFPEPPPAPVRVHLEQAAGVPPPVDELRQLDRELAAADPTRPPSRRRPRPRVHADRRAPEVPHG